MLEEKLKKVTTERAPVAGAGTQRGGRGGGRSILDGLVDPGRGSTGNSMVDQILRNAQGRNSPLASLLDLPSTPGAPGATGAAYVPGLEDDEDDEDANVPNEFEYYSDNGSDDEL